MRYENGVPSSISDLDTDAAGNNPYDTEEYSKFLLVSHIRALSAFIAQQEKRISELEIRVNKSVSNAGGERSS